MSSRARILLAGNGPRAAVAARALAALEHDVIGPFDSDAPPRRARCCDVAVACGGRAGVGALRAVLPRGATVLNCCAPPWESTPELASYLARADLSVVSNPHRADESITDFLHPDLVVLGSDDPNGIAAAAGLFRDVDAPRLRTDVATADLLPHAVDDYLHVRQVFADQVSALCAALGADVDSVAEALSYDSRLGPTSPVPQQSPSNRPDLDRGRS